MRDEMCFWGLSIKEGQLHVDYKRCWGCGLCAKTCPQKAVKVKAIRKASHMPKSRGDFAILNKLA